MLTPEQELARRTRRGFIGLGLGGVAAFAGLGALFSGVDEDHPVPPAFRGVLNTNQSVIRNTIFRPANLAKTFPASAIGKLKKNGDIGLDEEEVAADWRLATPTGKLSIADVQALPKHSEIIEFKCVEGWSTVTQFSGARVSDFIAKFAPAAASKACVGMKTPNEEYYVSIDMPSAMHPQTLLAWEMNGEPLTQAHGAPLRLVVPVKYGIKNIKNIGSIEYTDSPTPDYWEERGYDWYAGL